MKTWADFYDFCNADVPGVSSFAAERELRRAAQEFCEKTKVWKARLDPVYIFPNVDIYDLEVSRSATIVKVTEVTMDGEYVHLLTPGLSGSGGIQFLNQLQFRVLPMPSERSQLVMEAVLTPSHTATGVEDALFDQYARIIGRGAKAALYLQPQKPYTNPALAAIEQEAFDLAIAREKISAAKGYSGAPLRVRPLYI